MPLHQTLARKLPLIVIDSFRGSEKKTPTVSNSPKGPENMGGYWGSFGTSQVSEVSGASGPELEIAVERHPTDDGTWQPPPEPPLRARFYAPGFAVATEPEASRGTLLEFDAEADPPAWFRMGGRIQVRTE